MNDWQAEAEERLRGILKELQAENTMLKAQINQLLNTGNIHQPDPRFPQARVQEAREVY